MSLSTTEVVVDYLKAFNFYLDEGMVNTRNELDVARPEVCHQPESVRVLFQDRVDSRRRLPPSGDDCPL